MESHIRVYIQANWDALKYLSCGTYKVLMALVQRADNVGRCFPGVERIAQDTDLHIRTVYKALETLELTRYIGYLRRNECDQVTGRFLPNVYQVSPHFICIAVDNQIEALALWKSIYKSTPLPMPFESKVHTNQQQEPASENQHQITNNSKQQQQPPFATESVQDDELRPPTDKPQKSKKAKSKNDRADSDKQGVAQQQSEKHGRSAKITGRYVNPDPMPTALPDGTQEALAERVNHYGIPIPLSRGMILAHGYEPVLTACNQLDATAKKQKLDNPGGFFRYLLERRLLDARLPEVLEQSNGNNYTSGEYAEFIQS